VDNQYVLYPIHLGEVLNERYLVEHKLGFGGGSTVWMAFDLQDKRDVALKVIALGQWADNEIRIQDEILKTVQNTSRLVIYTATFILPRDNKSHHRVLVFPMNLSALLAYKRFLRPLVCLPLGNYYRLWQVYMKLGSCIAVSRRSLISLSYILRKCYRFKCKELYVGNDSYRWSQQKRQV
jgi:serine/threonine protein kinase